MRLMLTGLILCMAGSGTLLAQQNVKDDAEFQQLKQELREVVSTLRETRDELRASQREIEALRMEVVSLRSSGGAAPPTPDSGGDIADELTLLKQQQQILSTRVDQQYQTKVESGSKYRVRLSGLVLFNASSTRGSVNEQDVPMLAEPQSPGTSGGSISATMRQTLVNVDIFGPEFAGARTSANLQFDFFGGFPYTQDGAAMGIARFRVGKAKLDWDKWSLTIGQDKPFISPNSPTSLATIGTPGFGYSGDLWTWTPQIVAERRWAPSDTVMAKTQFGVLDPFNGSYAGYTSSRNPEPGERSRTPAISARQSIEFGSGSDKSSIGFGGYFARQDYNFGRILDAWAGTLDWNILLGRHFEFTGLLYRGEGLGGLWGGIGTSAVFDGNPDLSTSELYGVNTIGGWSQLKFKPAAKWEINAGFGEDSPFASDLRNYDEPSSAYYNPPYLRNWSTMFNVIERPRSNLMFSLEYRHLNTVGFSGVRNTAEHINLGVGVSF
jgi:hypothetical protein